MKIQPQYLELEKTGRFSSIFLDFLAQKETLKDFYGLAPQLENFEFALQNRSFEHRNILYQSLCRQYAHCPKKPQLALDLLTQENTFTVTTGHQLNIFSGPLYFHYKIISVINTAKILRKHFPQYNFVPVYWMASEDHDAQEIASFRLFGKKYEWQNPQKGAVGRFSPKSLLPLMEQMTDMSAVFWQAYQENTLAQATRYFVNELYAHEALVVIDGDDAQLKSLFVEKMQKEVFEQISHQKVSEQSQKLKDAGYATQVFPREINLFYLDEQLRERIVPEKNGFRVLNTSIFWTKEQILQELNHQPQKFSPNVILRPLYQETILPNLSYTGGPGEIAYWLQLKSTFEAFQTPFPILMPRNFALILGKNDLKKMQKLDITHEEIFEPMAYHKEKYLQKNAGNEHDLEAQKSEIQAVFEQIAQKASAIDQSLEAFVKAEEHRVLASTEKIQKKIQKALQQQHQTAFKQIESLLDKLFPENSLQEREDNFLNFYLNNPHFLSDIAQFFNPFLFKMLILELEQ